MDTQPNADQATEASAAKSPTSVDPLRRVFDKNIVFIPIEKRMTNGNRTFQTSDKERYIRTPNGVIRRAVPKVNGKQAKKVRRACRP